MSPFSCFFRPVSLLPLPPRCSYGIVPLTDALVRSLECGAGEKSKIREYRFGMEHASEFFNLSMGLLRSGNLSRSLPPPFPAVSLFLFFSRFTLILFSLALALCLPWQPSSPFSRFCKPLSKVRPTSTLAATARLLVSRYIYIFSWYFATLIPEPASAPPASLRRARIKCENSPPAFFYLHLSPQQRFIVKFALSYGLLARRFYLRASALFLTRERT